MSPGHCGTVGIVPPKYVAQVGDAGFAVKPVGTGPYKFVEWVKDERLVLEANKDYHRGAPGDRSADLPARARAHHPRGRAPLRAGGPRERRPAGPGRQGQGERRRPRRRSRPLGGFVIMVKITNYLMPGPWQDARVRKAINHAIDMDTIIKTVLEGYGQVLGVPLEKEAFGFNPNIKWYGYDPERAKTLLREAGHPNGFEMTLHVPNRRYMNDIEVVQAMAQMLGKVGIKAKVEVGEQSVYTTKWRQRAAPARLHDRLGRRRRLRRRPPGELAPLEVRAGHLQERGPRQDPGGRAGDRTTPRSGRRSTGRRRR